MSQLPLPREYIFFTYGGKTPIAVLYDIQQGIYTVWIPDPDTFRNGLAFMDFIKSILAIVKRGP
jgi:hypothetical protein